MWVGGAASLIDVARVVAEVPEAALGGRGSGLLERGWCVRSRLGGRRDDLLDFRGEGVEGVEVGGERRVGWHAPFEEFERGLEGSGARLWEPVDHPVAAPFGTDQAALSEEAEVFGHRHLPGAQNALEMLDAQRTSRQEADHAGAQGVGKTLANLGQFHGTM